MQTNKAESERLSSIGDNEYDRRNSHERTTAAPSKPLLQSVAEKNVPPYKKTPRFDPPLVDSRWKEKSPIIHGCGPAAMSAYIKRENAQWCETTWKSGLARLEMRRNMCRIVTARSSLSLCSWPERRITLFLYPIYPSDGRPWLCRSHVRLFRRQVTSIGVRLILPLHRKGGKPRWDYIYVVGWWGRREDSVNLVRRTFCWSAWIRKTTRGGEQCKGDTFIVTVTNPWWNGQPGQNDGLAVGLVRIPSGEPLPWADQRWPRPISVSSLQAFRGRWLYVRWLYSGGPGFWMWLPIWGKVGDNFAEFLIALCGY